MKTVFIVNPKAGKGEKSEAFAKQVKETIESAKADASVYITKAVGDATEYVREHCEKHGAARFIACGGDGTLSEVLNGAVGFDDAEIGVVPSGTGNDFCRNFGKDIDFHNILHQLDGKTVKCDAIRYETLLDGMKNEGYCVNMFNIGFDCNVADMTADMKKVPFVSGSLAYFASIFVALVKKKCSNLKIELDGDVKHDGKLLLTSLANGCFCGGGIKSNPLAEVNDGLININIIKNVPRLRFISLLPYYMKGTVLELKNIDRYITSQKCRKVTVTPVCGKNIRLCVDGEIIDAGRTEFEIVHNAFNFVLPCESTFVKANAEAMV